MLVLTRKKDEKVFITLDDGREIVVSIIKILGGVVRLSFECEREIKIVRHDAKKREKD